MLALTLVVGIVLPKVAAAVHLVFPSDVMVLVLCTGDGLVTVKIGADGEPISEPKVISEPCVMAVAVTPTAQDLTHWQRLSHALPFMLILSISGGVYLYKPQIEEVIYADRLNVEATGAPLPITDQIAAVKAEYGLKRLRMVTYPL